MKSQILFSRKINKEYLKMLSTEIFTQHAKCYGNRIHWTNLRIKHGFSYINIHRVPREVLKTEAGGRSFQHLPRDLANVNALKNHVRMLLLHKKVKTFATFCVISCTTLFRSKSMASV